MINHKSEMKTYGIFTVISCIIVFFSALLIIRIYPIDNQIALAQLIIPATVTICSLISGTHFILTGRKGVRETVQGITGHYYQAQKGKENEKEIVEK